jgi:hypothetical protein
MREHPICGEQHTEMPVGVVAIVGCVDAVLAEADGVGNFVWHLVDAHGHAELGQREHDVGMKFRDRDRPQHDLA